MVGSDHLKGCCSLRGRLLEQVTEWAGQFVTILEERIHIARRVGPDNAGIDRVHSS